MKNPFKKETRYRTEVRNWGRFHYVSHDGGATWEFTHSESSDQLTKNAMEAHEQWRTQIELK